MSDTPAQATPATQAPEAPSLFQTIILPKIMRAAFVLVRMAIVALVTWAATHKIVWVSDLLGANVDAIAAAIIGAISVAFHEADISCHQHPEMLPDWARVVWNVFHKMDSNPMPAGLAGVTDADIAALRDAATKLPTVQEIKKT